MKIKISVLIGTLVLTAIVAAGGFAGLALAEDAAVSEIVELKPPITNAGGAGLGLAEIIENVANFIFGLALVIAPIFIVWGGFLIATAAGSEDKVKKGKDNITYAVIGLVIIAISRALAAAIQNILK